MGGETESAEKVLLVLINNATIEKRFNDAAYLHWLLATQCLDLASSSTDERLAKFKFNLNKKYICCFVIVIVKK